MVTEHVFKALADHHRRHLLQALSQRNGQTLSELCEALPISRVGVMKHLRILEDAGLVQTRKSGRHKLHYLSPAPLDAVAAWVEQFRNLREESYDRLGELLDSRQSPQSVDSEQSEEIST